MGSMSPKRHGTQLMLHLHRLLGARKVHHSSSASMAWDCTVPAFCFDIDGVLIKGNKVLDAAKAAMARLYSKDGQSPQYPVCFLTNGGGVLESKKAEQLSGWLGVNVMEEQVILSHTPFKSLLPRLAETPVLVSGRQDIQRVAASYGFQRTVSVDQLAQAYPRAVPNYPPLQSGKSSFRTRLGSEEAPIEAVLVFSDPANWYLDLQLILDVIKSGGVLGRQTPPKCSKPMEVVFSNPDKLFSTDFPTPRLGQGAFQAALRALLNEVADKPPVQWRTFGKPNPEPYQLAMTALNHQARKLLAAPSKAPACPIYMIGDNPEADMAGATNAGKPWQSILVRTGVFDASAPNSLAHPADLVVDDVKDAVDAAVHRHRNKLWHSMR